MKLNERINNAHRTRIEQQAKCIFQVEEFNGSLWLTFDGNLICPTTFFKEDPLTTLREIRELFIQRRTQ